MTKRGKHEGSISKRADGRWEARLTLPDGKRKSFYAATRKEVADRLRGALHDLGRGVAPAPEKQTLTQYLTAWLETSALRTDGSTQRRYRDLTHNYILPALGTQLLARLTDDQIQACYNDLAKRLAASTVRLVHIVLHHALQDALKRNLVVRNVSDLVVLPRQARSEMQPFDESQASILLDASAGDRLEALYVLALTTGMRQGELLGLQWQDLDLDAGEVHVRQALQESPALQRTFILAEPKTPHSKRTIALSQTAIAALRKHRAAQGEERLQAGPDWRKTGLVFPNALGDLQKPRAVLHQYKKLLKRAKLPERRFHDLRHTFATIALARGINPKVVSEALGHSDIAITLRVYGHVMPHMQQAVATMMDAIFAKRA